MTTTADLLMRALIFLEWFAKHDGECLADHENIQERLVGVIKEIEEHLALLKVVAVRKGARRPVDARRRAEGS